MNSIAIISSQFRTLSVLTGWLSHASPHCSAASRGVQRRPNSDHLHNNVALSHSRFYLSFHLINDADRKKSEKKCFTQPLLPHLLTLSKTHTPVGRRQFGSRGGGISKSIIFFPPFHAFHRPRARRAATPKLIKHVNGAAPPAKKTPRCARMWVTSLAYYSSLRASIEKEKKRSSKNGIGCTTRERNSVMKMRSWIIVLK